MTHEDINRLIKEHGVDTNLVSDGYHNFFELYEHRITLFITLAKFSYTNWLRNDETLPAWRTKSHSDGSVWEGWFILGLGTEPGEQITYHLPMSKWDECSFAATFEKAPEWDGHTSADVLERLKKLTNSFSVA